MATLATNALTTLSTVKADLGISNVTSDGTLARLINAASDFVERTCKRSFYYEAARVDTLSGYGTNNLIVEKAPLLDIASITYSDGTVDSDNYSIGDADAGLIFNEYGWVWTAQRMDSITLPRIPGTEKESYTVTYEGGYVTPKQEEDAVGTRSLPYDLEDAVIRMVVNRFRRLGADTNIASEGLMSYSVSYRTESISSDVMSILNSYVRYSV